MASPTNSSADAVAAHDSPPPLPHSPKQETRSPDGKLALDVWSPFLAAPEASALFSLLTAHTRWHRVKYRSRRFNKQCTTPCWTTFYGGPHADQAPHQPLPPYLQPIVDGVSAACATPFNAILVRLYFDGNDEIAYHTDGRTFLGTAPVIASLSLGETATFQMRKMTEVWPGRGTPDGGVDPSEPVRNFSVGHGDLLVMLGKTQDHWHHRVPKEKGRRPRLNINFRYIVAGEGAKAEAISRAGQTTYYKYMVTGDKIEPGLLFSEIMRKSGKIEIFFGAKGGPRAGAGAWAGAGAGAGTGAGAASTTTPPPTSTPPTAAAAAAVPAAVAAGKKRKAALAQVQGSEWVDGNRDCSGRIRTGTATALKPPPSGPTESLTEWACSVCTYLNPKPLALSCELCSSIRA